MERNEGVAEVNGGNQSGRSARENGKRKAGEKTDCGWDEVMERWKNWKRMGGQWKV